MDQVSEGYAFSKEAVIVWTQFMGASLIKKGIRINTTLPSPTETPMMASFHQHSGKDIVDAAAEPLGRYTTAAEQAGPLVLLCSDPMTVVTGVVKTEFKSMRVVAFASYGLSIKYLSNSAPHGLCGVGVAKVECSGLAFGTLARFGKGYCWEKAMVGWMFRLN